MPEKQIELAEAIDELRKQIYKAIGLGKGEALSFTVKEMEIELKYSIQRNEKANVGVKFYVFNAGLDAKTRNETVHTLRLKLNPNYQGKPVKFSDED